MKNEKIIHGPGFEPWSSPYLRSTLAGPFVAPPEIGLFQDGSPGISTHKSSDVLDHCAQPCFFLFFSCCKGAGKQYPMYLPQVGKGGKRQGKARQGSCCTCPCERREGQDRRGGRKEQRKEGNCCLHGRAIEAQHIVRMWITKN